MTSDDGVKEIGIDKIIDKIVILSYQMYCGSFSSNLQLQHHHHLPTTPI